MIPSLIEWLATHGALLVLITFFGIFLAFGIWAYRPGNKNKLNAYSQIPLKESGDDR